MTITVHGRPAQMGSKRVSVEQIVAAYRETGSVWKSAKILGICGQSVWERLKAIDYPMQRRIWTADEYTELKRLSETLPIAKIAEALGRPYYAVAIKMSRRGLAKRWGKRGAKKLKRGDGYNKDNTTKWLRELKQFSGSLRQFCKQRGLFIDRLVAAIQTYYIDDWNEIAKRSDLPTKECPYCGCVFHPMTARQQTCTRKCSGDMKRDSEYFGGKRRNAIGLSEGICQLCLQPKEMLSAHHVLGKQHDPDNECLIAVCRGCHQLIGQLAGRKFVDHREGWENLIQLVMARRMAEKSTEHCGVYACVDMKYLTHDECFED